MLGLLRLTTHATVYVNNLTGNDSNSGISPDLPVKTLAAGMRKLYATGDLKLVIAKTAVPYFETLRITRGGTAAKSLIIEGGGAVINGLREIPTTNWQKQGKAFFFPSPSRPPLMPYLVINGKKVPQGKTKADIKPFSHYWADSGVYFRPETGKDIGSYKIFGTLLKNGVEIRSASYIICRNLSCERFSNDGFNIHGSCQFNLFENIIARHNGDDGFSVHDDAGTIVRNGLFYDNNFGIDDVNISRSDYYNIIAKNNHKYGIHFSGGMHSVINSVIKNNRMGQIKLNDGQADRMGISRDNPLTACLVFLKNVQLKGPVFGIYAQGRASVAILNSYIKHTPIGVKCDANARVSMTGVIIQSCSKAIIESWSKSLELNYSIVGPGNYSFAGKNYSHKNFKQWSNKCKVGKKVLLKKHNNASDNDFFISQKIKIPVGLTGQENTK